jgi:hypothetical protein
MWVDKARAEAQNYWFSYNRKMRVEDVTQMALVEDVTHLALHFGDDDSKVLSVFFCEKMIFYFMNVKSFVWAFFGGLSKNSMQILFLF